MKVLEIVCSEKASDKEENKVSDDGIIKLNSGDFCMLTRKDGDIRIVTAAEDDSVEIPNSVILCMAMGQLFAQNDPELMEILKEKAVDMFGEDIRELINRLDTVENLDSVH